MGEIMIERVYDYRQDPKRAGTVFLVDRLWPRGISKEDLDGVTWAQDAAPSPNLRDVVRPHEPTDSRSSPAATAANSTATPNAPNRSWKRRSRGR